MKVSRVIVAPFLALTLLGTSACANEPERTLVCAENEVLEVDEDGQECEPDENGNGIDDENEGEQAEGESESKDKKKKSTRRKRR